METKRDLEIEIKRILIDSEDRWDYLLVKEIRTSVKRASDFIEEKYASGTDIDMFEVLGEYQRDKEEHQRRNTLEKGYIYLREVLAAFAKDKDLLWKVYDSAEDKNQFFVRTEYDFDEDIEKNIFSFAKTVLSELFASSKLSKEDVEKMTQEQKTKSTESLHTYFKDRIRENEEIKQRDRVLATLKNTINELENLGDLQKSRKVHKEKMNLMGLDILSVPEDVNAIDTNGNFYGFNLEELSLFKLEAMLAFYLNRLEKAKENIGLGTFLITVMAKNERLYKDELETLSEDKIKEVWKRFYTMSKLLDENMDMLYAEALKKEQKGEKTELDVKDVYGLVMSKYEDVWKDLFGDDIDFKEEFFIFMTTNGFARRNAYVLKDELMDELIIQASREKINWGLIAEHEDTRPILSKMVLVGIDIPGMNMPLRLHCHLSSLRKLAKNKMIEEEVPLYVGNEDFRYMGKNIGTEIFMPLGQKESTWIKAVAKDKSKKPSNMLKHIACMQLPNMVKKLYDKKYFKRGEKIKQDIPDYIDLFTSKIRRNGVKIDNSRT